MTSKGAAICRNCGRTSDIHDEGYCKTVHLGGVPREQSKVERTEMKNKLEEKIEEIVFAFGKSKTEDLLMKKLLIESLQAELRELKEEITSESDEWLRKRLKDHDTSFREGMMCGLDEAIKLIDKRMGGNDHE